VPRIPHLAELSTVDLLTRSRPSVHGRQISGVISSRVMGASVSPAVGARVRPAVWAAGVVLAVTIPVYLTTCARTVTLVDSGELIVACATGGVAHPPGFPVYTMIGNLFSRLPLGSVALRLNLMSAFFAALASALVALVVGELGTGARTTATRGSRTRDEGVPRWIEAFLPALGAGATLAFSMTLWGYATVAEVYTLNLALLAAVLWLLLRWRRRVSDGEAHGWMLAGVGLVYGLALGVHHASVVLVAPALALFVWRAAGPRVFVSREAARALGGVAVGLLAYLYLPLAAARQPALSWGDPSSWERFVWHVTARQYQVNLFSGDLDVVSENLVAFLSLLYSQFTPLGLVVVVAGGVAGIQSALDLADAGHKVYLVEKEPSIGGIMAQLDKTYPTMDCSI